MRCQQCGGDTKVVTTYTESDTVHRLRRCCDCKWRCVTQERYIDEYYCINTLRANHKLEDLQRKKQDNG